MNHINRNHMTDAFVLFILNFKHASKLNAATEVRARRQRFLSDIKTLAEDGKIALVENGMDCDGVQYSGRVHIVAATVAAVESKADSIGDWADGPFNLELAAPTVAEGIHYASRDLAMEAH